MRSATPRLAPVYFWYFALLGGFMPYWSLYLHRELGLTAAAIGQLMAATVVVRMLAPPFWGRLADRRGWHLGCAQFGCLMLALVWLALGHWHSWSALVGLMLAYSFFQNAILAQCEAVALHELGHERYGRVRRWGSLGFIAAAATLGLLFEHLALDRLPSLLALLALLLLASSLGVRAARIAPAPAATRPLRAVLRRPAVQGFLGAGFLLQLAQAPYFTFYSLHLTEAGHASGTVGALWAVALAAEVFAFTHMHRLLAHWGARRLLKAGLLLAALRFTVIGSAPQALPALLAMQVLQGIGFAACHCAAMGFLQQHFGEGHRGQGQALYGMLWGSASALGAWLAGSFWTMLGAGHVFVLAALPCLLAAALLRPRRTAATPRPAPLTQAA